VTLEHSVAVEVLGWAATATFAGSYLAKRPETLVRVQIGGALMWAVYGVLVRSAPVIAANLLVVAAAAWKAQTGSRGEPRLRRARPSQQAIARPNPGLPGMGPGVDRDREDAADHAVPPPERRVRSHDGRLLE
jgi:hypothetical protein